MACEPHRSTGRHIDEEQTVMTSVIVLVLVGSGCLATAAWATWRDPASRKTLRQWFGVSEGR
jgi:hypothetical protein